MSVLLAIDPGIRGCGVALYDEGSLVQAAYVGNPAKSGNRAAEALSMAGAVMGELRRRPDQLAAEWPRVYASRIRSGDSKGDPNDLIALSAVVAAIGAHVDGWALSYVPSEWKGQMKKEACQARVMRRLSPYELRAATAGMPSAKGLQHNVWDAIAIGLHHLGRFAPKRVIAP